MIILYIQSIWAKTGKNVQIHRKSKVVMHIEVLNTTQKWLIYIDNIENINIDNIENIYVRPAQRLCS